jgi:SAM-dependent methyltransferase
MTSDVPHGASLAATIGCDFWDHHHHISEDKDFWMAHPACREAINRRVSGDRGVYPLDYLYASAGTPRFQRALSLGCGTGRLERAMSRLGIAAEIDAVDGSRVSIGIAQEKAEQEGLPGIRYRVADLNTVRLDRGVYDAVVFHQSLHHVASVEKLLERVSAALKPNGFLFLEEWTGPSRFEWNPPRLARARSFFEAVPEQWRKWPEVRAPIEEADPSEAVRSSAILPAVRRLFTIRLERPYGGQIVSILLPQVERERMPAGELDALIASWLALEEAELERDPAASVYTAILAVPRTGMARAVARLASLTVRARLALRYRFLGALQRPA